MFREGLPALVLIIGFPLRYWWWLLYYWIQTCSLDPDCNSRIICLFFRRQIKRQRGILVVIVSIWFVCVGIQRFVVPFVFDHVFQPYQVKRIYDAIGKDYVPKNALVAMEIEEKSAGKKKDNGNYNVKQSKIAISNGGLIGKGLLSGTQTRYDFVPEQRTDFIFCTIGEGFGFIGSIVFLSIYVILLMRIVTIAERQRSVFSRAYAYGVASVFFFHISINVCMTIGLAMLLEFSSFC
jgi:rod shape determining protein RodA